MAKKARTKVLQKGGGTAIVALTMPPNSTTGRHTEYGSYVVVPLTTGTLDRQTFVGKGNKFIKDKVRLKPMRVYERKVGRGLEHELFNNGSDTIVLLKFYKPKK